jgi:hypothetical protein
MTKKSESGATWYVLHTVGGDIHNPEGRRCSRGFATATGARTNDARGLHSQGLRRWENHSKS